METISLRDLDAVLGSLVQDGTLRGDQAAAVRTAITSAAVRPSAPAMPVLKDPADSRGVLVAAYVGVGLVVAAVGTFIGQQWDVFSRAQRVSMFGVLAVVLLFGGVVTRGRPGSTADAVRGLLWLVGAGCTGLALAATRMGQPDDELAVLLLGGGTLAAGLPAYAVRRSAAQFLAVWVGLLTVTGGVAMPLDLEPLSIGLLYVGLGVLLVALAVGGLLPDDLVYLAGGVTAFAGAEVVWFDNDTLASALAIGLAVLSYAVAVRRADLPAIYVATGTVALFGPQVLGEMFGHSLGAPAVLLGSGLLILGAVALHLAVARQRAARRT